MASKKNRSRLIFEKIINCGTEELREKFQVDFENIDMRGVFKRARVMDQTKIDKLFLDKELSAPQYGAAEEYLSLLVKSGAFLRSPGFESGPDSTGRDKAKSMAARMMAVSGARNKLRKSCGNEVCYVVDMAIGGDAIIDISMLRIGLDARADYFGTRGMSDPRG